MSRVLDYIGAVAALSRTRVVHAPAGAGIIVRPVEAVRASRLVKRYGPTTAVDGLDLTVCAGEVRGLVGPDRAGKTTLLRMLFDLITPDSGRVSLLGRELTGLSTAALEGVGGCVEEPAFYGYLSGRANLALLARLDGRRSAAAQIGDALARVDCYKAQSPPSFIGGPTRREAGGHSVANPLFVVYGCFNTF